MKNLNAIRELAIDSVSFLIALSMVAGGLLGLAAIEASFFSMSLFSMLMVPALFSTATYLSRDINKATHTLVA